MKRFVVTPFLGCLLLLCGCAAQYSSIKSDFQMNDANNNGTVQIIVGSPQKIFSALSDVIDEKFIVYSHSINTDAGKLRFRGKGTGALRGSVGVTITLKQVSGTTEKGEIVNGYSLGMSSEGVGPNASMFPQYAISNINEAFFKSLPEYNLSLVRVNNPKIEKYQTPIATLQETVHRANEECDQKKFNGELKNYVERAQCKNQAVIEAHQKAGDPNMDLVYLATAYRLALAERQDKTEITQGEADVMWAELIARVSQEARQRAMQQQAEQRQQSLDLQQQNNARMQAYGTLLQGLGTWQSANKIEVPKVSIPQTTMPNSGPGAQPRISITCQKVGDFTYCH